MLTTPALRILKDFRPDLAIAVVVEDRYSSIFKMAHAPGGFVADLLGALQVRYPSVPIFFAETRALAEEWTYRYLGAALAARRAGP